MSFHYSQGEKVGGGPEKRIFGLAISFRQGYDGAIATLELSAERIKKLINIARDPKERNFASPALLRKTVGALRSAQTMIIGRLGRAPLSPLYVLTASALPSSMFSEFG